MNDIIEVKRKIVEKLQSARNVLIVSHMNPDADAYGSTLGLGAILRDAGKTVCCLNIEGSNERFDFIPGIKSVVTAAPEGDWDTLICLDAASEQRLGEGFFDTLKASVSFVINIDHHISNTKFGDLAYVNATSSSTCEMLADVAFEFNWEVSKEAAIALLAGIYGDTGSFRYSCTSPSTFHVAQRLLATGADASFVGAALYGNTPLPAVRLRSHTLLNASIEEDGRLAMAVIHKATFDELGAKPEDAEGLVEEMRDIKDIALAALLYWYDDCWKVSLRSVSDDINVSALAKEFGGGGHVQAAAFRWRSDLDTVLPRLRQRLIETLHARGE